jgi:hypothetical protein
MTSPDYKFAMLAAWLEGYAEGLPDYCTAEKFKIKEAAELLMEVYEQRMKEKETWKQEIRDQA